MSGGGSGQCSKRSSTSKSLLSIVKGSVTRHSSCHCGGLGLGGYKRQYQRASLDWDPLLFALMSALPADDTLSLGETQALLSQVFLLQILQVRSDVLLEVSNLSLILPCSIISSP